MRGQMIFHPVLKWLFCLRFVTATIALEECDQLSLSMPCTCGSQLEKRFERSWSDHWQKVEGAPIEVFSSYLDERQWTQPNTVHLPEAAITVRTIAHGLQTEHVVNNIPPLFCSVHDGVEWMYVGRAEYVRVYRSSLHAEEYTTHFLLCFVPHSFRQVVTVGFGTAFCQITAAVDINHQAVLPSAGGEHALSVCVSPLHSVVEPLQVAEFIEMYRLLGATHFTFYNYKTTPSLRELLNRYSKANLTTIVPWYSLNIRQSYFYFDQRSALNDCLYRSAASATHVAVVDLDEFLVPRIDHGMSLLDLIKHHQRSSQHHFLYGSFCFQHVYFELNASDPSVATQHAKNKQLVTQTRFSRTNESYPKGTIRSKCIHTSHLTVSVDIHSVQWFVNDSVKQVVLPDDQALLHHYRSSRMETFRKHPELFTFENDYFLRTYHLALSSNVNAALSQQPIIVHERNNEKEEL